MVAGHQVRKDGCGYIMDATRPTSDGIVYGFQDRPRDYEVHEVRVVLVVLSMRRVL